MVLDMSKRFPKAPKNSHPAVAALYTALMPTSGAVLASALRGGPEALRTVPEAVVFVRGGLDDLVRTAGDRADAQNAAVIVALAELAKVAA